MGRVFPEIPFMERSALLGKEKMGSCEHIYHRAPSCVNAGKYYKFPSGADLRA